MSVEPSPPWITLAPCDIAPRPSAAASGSLLVRMSCSVTRVFAPVSRTNAAPTASATDSSSSSGDSPLTSYALKILSRSDTSAPPSDEPLQPASSCASPRDRANQQHQAGKAHDPVVRNLPRPNLSVRGPCGGEDSGGRTRTARTPGCNSGWARTDYDRCRARALGLGLGRGSGRGAHHPQVTATAYLDTLADR